MEEAGKFSGLSIYLWNQIAQKLNIEYRIEGLGLQKLLDSVSKADVDVGVSKLTLLGAGLRSATGRLCCKTLVEFSCEQ